MPVCRMFALNTLVSKVSSCQLRTRKVERCTDSFLHVADFVASDHAAQAGVASIHVVDVGDGTRKSKRLQTLSLNRARVKNKCA
jgi:hypothetical protein